MAVFKNDNGDELIVIDDYGCENAVRLKIGSEYGNDHYFVMNYMNPNWYRDQNGSFDVFVWKLKKIWRIIRNKDHYYSDIMMSRADFEVFKEYINSR